MPKAWFVALAALSKSATPKARARELAPPTTGDRRRQSARAARSEPRLIVGPFNRVEGDLEVTLDVADGASPRRRSVSPLYRGFEQMLLGQAPARRAGDRAAHLRHLLGVAVGRGRACAGRRGRPEMPPNGRLASNLMLPARTWPTT
jgi:hypothetical protein